MTEKPIKRYECLNCKSIVDLPLDLDSAKTKCCDSPNLRILFAEDDGKATEYLNEAYELLQYILGDYMDMTENHKKVIALWIIGTYFHNSFSTYPFLFINAMKGSGKTRLLKITSQTSKGSGGKVHTGIGESVLFRMKAGDTLVLDELESIGSKEKATLREYMNACYKKGGVVERVKKEKDNWVIEGFQPYKPIAMANIWGMDEILGDRCIPVILEKSGDPIRTKKIEDFDTNPLFLRLNELLNQSSVVCVVKFLPETYKTTWNEWINDRYRTHNYTTTYNTYNTNTTLTTKEKEKVQMLELEDMFLKIDNLGIDGRNLELLFPLFLIARLIREEVFNEFLLIGKEIMEGKKEDEFTESRDVIVYEFIANQPATLELVKVRDLVAKLKIFYGSEEDWINEKSFGRALKRLGLVLDKRRVASGMMVRINVAKAKEKLKIFKSERMNEKTEN